MKKRKLTDDEQTLKNMFEKAEKERDMYIRAFILCRDGLFKIAKDHPVGAGYTAIEVLDEAEKEKVSMSSGVLSDYQKEKLAEMRGMVNDIDSLESAALEDYLRETIDLIVKNDIHTENPSAPTGKDQVVEKSPS